MSEQTSKPTDPATASAADATDSTDEKRKDATPEVELLDLPDRSHLPVAADVPLDATSTRALAAAGLQYRVVPDDAEAFAQFCHAMERGFLGERESAESREAWRTGETTTRPIGVYDPAGAHPETPVATVVCWTTDLTVDLDSVLPMWAISGVTVSSTHRRRGVARALLEGELRAAASAGVPVAGLTVSEATIYGRYGFGPAAGEGVHEIQTRRAGWVGPNPVAQGRGRLDQVEREDAMRDIATLHGELVGSQPGDVAGWPTLWRQAAGLHPDQHRKELRAVRYTDAAGRLAGLVTYAIKGNETDYTASELSVRHLAATTPDAYAALWHYVLTHDLIGTVKAWAPLESPLRWLVRDVRAIRVRDSDDHWLRLLDVRRCLEARRYRTALDVELEVSDPVGIAGGRYRLVADANGAATVERVGSPSGESDAAPDAEVPDGVARLGVADLASLWLGSARWSTLRAAGRVAASEPTAQALDLAFTPSRPAHLTFGY
ncbi:GNAT family N-acetyltransferase [Miniimonas sp. S16]|uniref:GNAT family N-acetyltransferase n=1 Tax=Miniimonas sp. S16 TaxID=2171623 RepID=UPI000D5267F9|nr:GNAT family N-acetyltransferase [Miniimonas sp. S16]